VYCHTQDKCDFDARLCDLALPCLMDEHQSFVQACVYTGVENMDYNLEVANVLSDGRVTASEVQVQNCNDEKQEADAQVSTQHSDQSAWSFDIGGSFNIEGKLTESIGIPFVEKTKLEIQAAVEVDVSSTHAFTHTDTQTSQTTALVTAPPETVTNVSVICARSNVDVPYKATLQAMCRLSVKFDDSSPKSPGDVEKALRSNLCLLDLASKEDGFPYGISAPPVQAHLLRTGIFKSAQVSDCEVKIGKSLPLSCNGTTGVQMIPLANISATENTRHEP